MNLTEREKEIADEVWIKYSQTDAHINEMFGEFLSRLCEEQEAVAYSHKTIGYLDQNYKFHPIYSDICAESEKEKWIPLFTIPPAAPDCKELVEALEESNSLLVKILLGETDLKEIEEQTHDNRTDLANHAKRMQSSTNSRGEE